MSGMVIDRAIDFIEAILTFFSKDSSTKTDTVSESKAASMGKTNAQLYTAPPAGTTSSGRAPDAPPAEVPIAAVVVSPAQQEAWTKKMSTVKTGVELTESKKKFYIKKASKTYKDCDKELSKKKVNHWLWPLLYHLQNKDIELSESEGGAFWKGILEHFGSWCTFSGDEKIVYDSLPLPVPGNGRLEYAEYIEFAQKSLCRMANSTCAHKWSSHQTNLEWMDRGWQCR